MRRAAGNNSKKERAMFDSRNNLAAALSMAERGWHVFPCHTLMHASCSCGKTCKSPAKHPMTPRGHNDASCDLAWVRAVWEDNPWANIGIRTGPESGIWVLDPDGEDGIQDLAKLAAENGPLPRTPTLKTGSGGRHLYFAWPAGLDIKNTTKILGMSIDVRGAGGYVIGAGSSNVEGSYDWEINPEEAPLAEAPGWLLKLVTDRQLKPPVIGPAGSLPDADLVFEELTGQRKKSALDLDRDAELARQALVHLNHMADNYSDWIKVGMCLRTLGDAGLALWNEWSRQSAKYEEGVCEQKWETFSEDGGLTLGTLFHLAKQHGWQPSRTPKQKASLTNFAMTIERDILIKDDVRNERRFEGKIELDGVAHPFTIDSDDFADSRKFQAKVFSAVGPRAQFLGGIAAVRNEVSSLSAPEVIELTTSLGWTADGTAYLTPTGLVDCEGFRPYRTGEARVDLGVDGPPRGLGLCCGPIDDVKRHLTEDFLRLHDRPIMYTLLGGVALAILERFSGSTQRFAIWLKGLTGAGKSFPAKLAANFFGNYPLNDGGQFSTWSSTANYVERTGYYFRDSLYLVDDYKPEVVTGPQAVRVLQAYADSSGRGRLQADAKANITRPIRGLLISTGEDLPQNNASSLARMIVVNVPNGAKDHDRGKRCLEMRPSYPALTADFVRWLITEGRLAGFAAYVTRHRKRFYEGIAGQQNDSRIAGNFALLAAAFEEIALYLGIPSHDYVALDLVAIRDQMLGLVREQQGAIIFMDTLRMLLAYKKVYFLDDPNSSDGMVIGKASGDFYEISIGMALGAVQEQLKKQGRDQLKISEATLLQDLVAAGKVAPPQTKAGDAGKTTHPVRVGSKRIRCARIPRAELSGTPAHPET
jgi:hypothetical protein